MASRQLTLTAPRSRPDGTADVDLVRLDIHEDHILGEVRGRWICGRLVASAWTPSLETGTFAYSGSDWTAYLAEGAAAANQHEAQQDWIFDQLITAGTIGAGVKGDY